MNSVVSIAQNDDIALSIEQSLTDLPLDDLLHDRMMVIKPNDTYASRTDITGVTQADTLRAVIRYQDRDADLASSVEVARDGHRDAKHEEHRYELSSG